MKNEASLSKLFPDYWAEKGHVHPAGFFQAAQDANYIILRMDTEGDYEYHVLYHEYTHAVVRLNFNYLPPWLNEGFAEFVGNTTFKEKSIEVGQPSPTGLLLLRQKKLLPLDQLFQVTERSSYYNEANLANIFYAESWALVHFLMVDPTQRKADLLDRYIEKLAAGMNSLDAAKAAFGDLGQLQQTLQKYVTQQSYFEIEIKLKEELAGAQTTVRSIPMGEVEALQGEMEYSRGKSDLAESLIEAAIKDDPQLASPYVTLGMLRFRAGDRSAALDNFSKAISLDTTNYHAYYDRAVLAMSGSGLAGDDTQVISDLEKTVALNPQFAPAYSILAHLYIRQPEMRDKALASAQMAAKLDPGNFDYQIGLGYLLTDLDRLDDARALAHRLGMAAKDENEQNAAQNLDERIASRADYDQRTKNSHLPQESSTQGESNASGNPPPLAHRGDGDTTTPDEQPEIPANTGAYAIGTVVSAQCTGTELLLVLDVLKMHYSYHAVDASKIDYLDAQGNPSSARPACGDLRGQRIKLSYQPVQGKDWEGEVLSIRRMN
jgi:tetratricopeptide (TPR) repeat protein